MQSEHIFGKYHYFENVLLPVLICLSIHLVCQIKFFRINVQASMIDGSKTISSMSAPFETVTCEVCDYI